MELRKLFIIYLLLTIITSGNLLGQTNEKTRTRFAGCWSGQDGVINMYVDSLNFIRNKAQLPVFLEDYLYDWKRKDGLASCLKWRDEEISFRRVILERVTNEQTLEWIIASDNHKYDKKYDPNKLKIEMGDHGYDYYPLLPFMDKSWRDLAKLRQEEIREKKKIFSD